MLLLLKLILLTSNVVKLLIHKIKSLIRSSCTILDILSMFDLSTIVNTEVQWQSSDAARGKYMHCHPNCILAGINKYVFAAFICNMKTFHGFVLPMLLLLTPNFLLTPKYIKISTKDYKSEGKWLKWKGMKLSERRRHMVWMTDWVRLSYLGKRRKYTSIMPQKLFGKNWYARH